MLNIGNLQLEQLVVASGTTIVMIDAEGLKRKLSKEENRLKGCLYVIHTLASESFSRGER